MTRRTRRRLLFGLPASLAVALVAAWLLWPRTAITRENAAKIQVGMTLAEVEAVLGGPARDESTGPLIRDSGEDVRGDAEVFAKVISDDIYCRLWTSNHVIVGVTFGAEGHVTDMFCVLVRPADESLLDRLRQWLGL